MKLQFLIDTEGSSCIELTDEDAAKLSEKQIDTFGNILALIIENLRRPD